jgi:TolB protein
MYSLVLNRSLPSNRREAPPNPPPGLPTEPSWLIPPASGDTQIYIGDADGAGPHAVTSFRGPNVSPCFNPKTGSQIAWVGGRTNLPQIYIADTDGGNVQRMTDGGYATSPSWSPNGQFLTFAWDRKYGPGAPGGQDIYIMDIASKRWTQLTHDAGRNDFPSWAPDGRHIVFEREVNHRAEIWSMLADGTQQQQLTRGGEQLHA